MKSGEFICLICGEPGRRRPSVVGERVFCSPQCSRTYRRTHREPSPWVEIQGCVARLPLLSASGVVRGHTIIDSADVEWAAQWTWSIQGKGYACRTQGCEDGRREFILLHRELLGLPRRGSDPQGDHVNRNKLDNRRENLRTLTVAGNRQNLGLYASNRSGYRGVHFAKELGRWVAKAALSGRNYFLGAFDTAEEAAVVVSEWRREHMPYSTIDTSGSWHEASSKAQLGRLIDQGFDFVPETAVPA